MALNIRTFDGTDWNDFDLDTYGFCRPVISIGYSKPAVLRFRFHAPQHSPPIPKRMLISFEDTEYSGHPNAPIFLGHVWEINPSASFVLEYVCYGVDMRARNEITIMSGPHGDPDVIPRLIYNAKIDNADVAMFEFAHDASVGEIIADLLTNSYNELLTNCHAAPLTGGSDAFNSADLTSLDFKPQEKVVFESEQLGAGISRLLNYHPTHRLIFEPGFTSDRNRWRFPNVTTADQITLTLNKFDANKHVLSMTLSPSIAQRYTAVTIFGPQQLTFAMAYSEAVSDTEYEDPGLTNSWNGTEAINFQANGPGAGGIGDAGKKWEITDAAKRKISRLMPGWILLDDSQFSVNGQSYQQRKVKTPVLQATWDEGDSWWTIQGIIIDYQQGTIEASMPVFKYQPDNSPVYKLPDNFRFAYGYFDDPVSVRKPTTGFEGTAFSVLGMQVEHKLYDEMLAVGFENGTPVTLSTRSAQYEILAQAILDSRKDIVHTGGCVIAGIDYDFILLQKRVSFEAVDGNGGLLITGWESIDAVLTDVEYDYENDTTTLTFSSDASDFSQDNIEDLKRRLKIRATRVERFIETTYTFGRAIGVFNNIRNYVVSEGDTGEEEIIGEY